ncbi:MAG TPA: pilus assembly PilX N-terminal domain-containing protein [Candidatus Sulfotelmatobacter sp.]|nr:pilus assembly PilX N-terminal domain-containing protein [Candidatus Sulfotelmatobacter sp.]
MLKTRKNKIKDDENGFASLVIALIVIVVLGLLTVGFAQLARREQQNSLNNALANQAYYAAESGVNDTLKDIADGYINQAWLNSEPAGGCLNTTGLNQNALTYNKVLNAADYIGYSCLMVNLSPSNLTFNNTPPGQGQYVEFTTTAPISNLTVQWGSADGQNVIPSTFTSDDEFSPLATWNKMGQLPVLQFNFTPIQSTVTRQGLISSTSNEYLYPYTGGSTACSVSSGIGGCTPVQPVKCAYPAGGPAAQPLPCSIKLANVPTGGVGAYLIHFLPYYDQPYIYITATDSMGNPVNFIGQYQIDVTGYAHNVLRRIQVRINSSSGSEPLLPSSAIEAQNICKREDTQPANTAYWNPQSRPVTNSATDPCNLSRNQ